VVVAGPGYRTESDVLLREIDTGLAGLRVARPAADVEIAERIAVELRRLVVQTARASAADRARVCAAVRYFTSRAFASALGPPVAPVRRQVRTGIGARSTVLGNLPAVRRPVRPMRADIRVVGDILHGLTSTDLISTT
jgi:hypothetical protein